MGWYMDAALSKERSMSRQIQRRSLRAGQAHCFWPPWQDTKNIGPFWSHQIWRNLNYCELFGWRWVGSILMPNTLKANHSVTQAWTAVTLSFSPPFQYANRSKAQAAAYATSSKKNYLLSDANMITVLRHYGAIVTWDMKIGHVFSYAFVACIGPV